MWILRGLHFPIRMQPPGLHWEPQSEGRAGQAQPIAAAPCCAASVDFVRLARAVPCHVLCCMQDRPSIRYIRDVLRMRSSAFIEMRFVRPTAALMTAMEAAGGAGSKRADSYVRRAASRAGECSSLQGSRRLPLAPV